MNDKRIVFMGTPKFSATILEALLNGGYNVVLCVSQPDKPVGRKKILTPSPVKIVANAHSIDIFTPNSIKNEYQKILDYKPDLIITCAYGQFLPKELLDAPVYKSINVHGSLLPKYRGASPVQRAIMNGEDKTGITLMYMNEKMDEGDILVQESLPIDIKDTSTTLFDKLSDLGLKMILDFLPKLFDGNVNPIKQDHTKATIASNLNKDDEHIDFNNDVLSVYNHIRGMLDNPGCYFIVDDIKYKIHETFYKESSNTKPSYIYGLDGDSFNIGTNNGYIQILKIQKEGKSIMSSKDFNNGVGKSLVGKICK